MKEKFAKSFRLLTTISLILVFLVLFSVIQKKEESKTVNSQELLQPNIAPTDVWETWQDPSPNEELGDLIVNRRLGENGQEFYELALTVNWNGKYLICLQSRSKDVIATEPYNFTMDNRSLCRVYINGRELTDKEVSELNEEFGAILNIGKNPSSEVRITVGGITTVKTNVITLKLQNE